MTDRDKLIEAMAKAISRYEGYGEYITSVPRAQAALAAIEANGLVVVPGWQPIESAPRDGRRVCAKGRDFGNPEGDEHFVWAEWREGDWWDADDENQLLQHLTHCMPLPAAPNQGEG